MVQSGEKNTHREGKRFDLKPNVCDGLRHPVGEPEVATQLKY